MTDGMIWNVPYCYHPPVKRLPDSEPGLIEKKERERERISRK